MRCLLVDDDAAVSHALKEGMVEYCGAFVICAGDGATATRILNHETVDLAVIDLILPDISGFELAARAVDRNVPVVVISGHPERTELCESCDYPYLAKPFRMRELVAAATHAVQNARDNVARVQASSAKLNATLAQVQAATHSAARIVDESRNARMASAAARAARRGERARSCTIAYPQRVSL